MRKLGTVVLASLFALSTAHADTGAMAGAAVEAGKSAAINAAKGMAHSAVDKAAGMAEGKAAGGTIVETAMSNPKFSTLVSLIKEAGLVETLSGEGPFTVFAPTNEAFSKIAASDLAALKADKSKLTKVLTYHVVSGKVPAEKVVGLSEAATVQGSSVKISKSGGGVMVDKATVTATDIMASNGIIHVVDSVLMPSS